MKKLILLLTTLMFMVPILAEATSQRTLEIKYKKSIMRFTGEQEVYVDPETGVEYIVIFERKQYGLGVGITPRLNADGTLRVNNMYSVKVTDGGFYGIEF
jgi:hypothetical protein